MKKTPIVSRVTKLQKQVSVPGTKDLLFVTEYTYYMTYCISCIPAQRILNFQQLLTQNVTVKLFLILIILVRFNSLFPLSAGAEAIIKFTAN